MVPINGCRYSSQHLVVETLSQILRLSDCSSCKHILLIPDLFICDHKFLVDIFLAGVLFLSSI